MDLCVPAFLFDIFFAFPCAIAFLFRVPMLLYQRVYVWGVGWGCDSSHTRCVCMDGSGGPGQLATSPLPPLVTRAWCRSILAGSRFGVKLIPYLVHNPPLLPLLSEHVITVSSHSLHRNANSAFLFFRVPRSCIKFAFPCVRVPKIPGTRERETRNARPSLVLMSF